LLSRSEQLSRITEADMPLLEALGLKKIYDLRTTDERAAQPDRVPARAQDVVVDVLADAPSYPAQCAGDAARNTCTHRRCGVTLAGTLKTHSRAAWSGSNLPCSQAARSKRL